jgi:hypothetical protein
MWYSKLWGQFIDLFAKVKAHIFICDTPGQYYFGSFIPSALLLSQLAQNNINFAGYTYQVLSKDVHLVPNLINDHSATDASAVEILTHLPTCSYDSAYFQDEISKSGFSIINIESRYFNTPLKADINISLTNSETLYSALEIRYKNELNSALEKIKVSLNAFFLKYLTIPNYRERQVEYITEIYRSQLITFFSLCHHFVDHRPTKMLLSNHDGGFHGPLMSLAKKYSIPVYLLPHSKTATNIEFQHKNTTVLAHPIQEMDIFDRNESFVRQSVLLYPEKFTGSNIQSNGIKSVCLLLNAISQNGIYYTPYDIYLSGIKLILDWCNSHNILLKIRSKPYYTLITPLARDLGIDIDILQNATNQSMDQYTEDCDLCLMYDNPTSGSLFFLRNSIPIVCVSIDTLSPEEMMMMNTSLIPMENIENTLLRLKRFVVNPSFFNSFRNDQFRNYIQLFRDAKSLRELLHYI